MTQACAVPQEEDVYRDVLEPSKALLTDEFKVIAEHRKKTEDRRLQFDFRRTKNGKAKEAQKPLPYDDAAMKEAEDKMLSSKGEATDTMTALLEAQPAHLARIDQFLSAHVDFLKEALDALTAARDEVRGKMASPAGRVDYKANIAAGMGSVKSSADAKLAAVGALMGKASSVGGSGTAFGLSGLRHMSTLCTTQTRRRLLTPLRMRGILGLQPQRGAVMRRHRLPFPLQQHLLRKHLLLPHRQVQLPRFTGHYYRFCGTFGLSARLDRALGNPPTRVPQN